MGSDLGETMGNIIAKSYQLMVATKPDAVLVLGDTGLPKERTYVTGSPMAEVLHNNLKEIEASDIHQRLAA